MAELRGMAARISTLAGDAHPVLELVRHALEREDSELIRAAAAACRATLGDEPCPRCRADSDAVYVPISAVGELRADRCFYEAVRIYRALEAIGVLGLERLSLVGRPAPGGRLQLVGSRGIRINPASADHFDELVERQLASG